MQGLNKSSGWNKPILCFFSSEEEKIPTLEEIKDALLELAEAYALSWHERTEFQRAITAYGICWGLDYLLQASATKNPEYKRIFSEMAPADNDNPAKKEWWERRFHWGGPNPIWKTDYDYERCLMCCLIAARLSGIL